MADEDPPLVPSQGVGTGGAGHVCSGVCRLSRVAGVCASGRQYRPRAWSARAHSTALSLQACPESSLWGCAGGQRSAAHSCRRVTCTMMTSTWSCTHAPRAMHRARRIILLIHERGAANVDAAARGAGSRSVFRLPPPIPGKPGGGYPQEWHSAQTTIKRNYLAHMERKRARAPVMQEVRDFVFTARIDLRVMMRPACGRLRRSASTMCWACRRRQRGAPSGVLVRMNPDVGRE